MKPFYCITAWVNCAAVALVLNADGGPVKTSLANPQPSNRAAQDAKAIPQHPQPEAKGLVAFSPDGEFYVFASPEGRLKYCRATDGVVLHTYYQCYPQAVVFSANGQLLACAGGSGNEPTTVKVIQVADGALLCKIQSETGSKQLLSFSPDGLLLASCAGKSSLNLWQLPAGTFKQSVTAGGNISALTWAKDGQDVVVVCANGSTQRFQVK